VLSKLKDKDTKRENATNTTTHLLFHLTRKIITNTASVDGGQMQNATNVVNWDM